MVTGFSGTLAPDANNRRPANKSAADLTFIDPDGVSARILDVSRPGFVWDGRVFPAPKKFEVLAKDVGQVFGIALDDQQAPNIYLSATSVFGLNIVKRGRDGSPERMKKGGPGAGWMKGQFGLDLQGSPGAIYKIDGRTGTVSLFANVTLDGVPNPGAGLGNLAYDAEHKQLFVSDLYTGMVHRFDLDGKDLGRYDHGATGLAAAKLAPVAFDPRNRPNIATERFDSEKPETWGYAPAPRRVWGLAVHQGRLFYSVVAGPQIWSVGIARDGGFAADARWEFDVPAQAGPLPVSDIAFAGNGAMLLAQRALVAGSYDYSAFTRPGEPQVLRVSLKGPNDPPSPGRWKLVAEEYAVGFAGNLRNTNGGVALGYGYGQDGALAPQACDAALWTTGQNLRNNPALRSQLDPGGPLVVHGLQGGHSDLVRRGNEPPATSYFVDYDDKLRDARAVGHMGSVRILTTPCAAPAANVAPVANIIPVGTGTGGHNVCTPTCVCPEGTVLEGKECVKRDCPAPQVFNPQTGTCKCPFGTVLRDGKCVPVIFYDGVKKCPPPMVIGEVPGVCVCPIGMTMVDGKCVPVRCRPPLVNGPHGTCICPDGGVLQGGKCVPPVCQKPLVPGPCACPDGTVNQDGLCVKGTPIDLKVEKTGDTSPPADVPWYGWHLKVTDVTGAINANGIVTITDVVPTGMQFDSATSSPPSDWSCNAPPTIPAGGTLTCTYNGGPITQGQVLSTIDIVARAIGNGPYPPITNCAIVGIKPGSDYVDSDPSNDQSCATVTKPGGVFIVEKKVQNLTEGNVTGWTYPITSTCGTPSSFSLPDGGTQTFNDIPFGSSCSVSENTGAIPVPINACKSPRMHPQWSTTYSPASVTIGTTPVSITVINKLECVPGREGEVIVVKHVESKLPITLPNLGYPLTVNCGGPDQNLTLYDNIPQTISGLTLPTSCTVTETPPPPPNICPPRTTPTWGTSINPASPVPVTTSPTTVTVTNVFSCEPVKTDVCPPPQVLNVDNICACPAPMVPGAVPGQCLCPAPNVMVGGQCVPPPVCQPPQVMIPGVGCRCPNGGVLVDGICVPPPPTCTAPQVPNSQGVCACPSPMTPGAVPGQCLCPDGQVLVGGACALPSPPVRATSTATCPPPKVPDANGKCICPPTMDDKGGVCVPKVDACRPPKTLNLATGLCACPTGTIEKDGQCVPPPPTCVPPTHLNQVTGKCECAPGVVPGGTNALIIQKTLQLPSGKSWPTASFNFDVVCTGPNSATLSTNAPMSSGYNGVIAPTCSQCTITERPQPVPPNMCPPGTWATMLPATYSPSNSVVTGVGTIPQLPGVNVVTATNKVICSPTPPVCQPPLVLGPTGCACPPGQVSFGGSCINPDDHKRRTEQCEAGTSLIDGVCMPPPVCIPPQVANANGVCGCPTSMQSGAIPGQCLCKQGSKMVGGQCIPDRKTDDRKKKPEPCAEGTVRQGNKCVKRKTDEPGIKAGDVIRGIGIINGIGGGGRGGSGGGRGGDTGGGTRGGGTPGKF